MVVSQQSNNDSDHSQAEARSLEVAIVGGGLVGLHRRGVRFTL